jgi:GNAT superfamily N-acetyltransferase
MGIMPSMIFPAHEFAITAPRAGMFDAWFAAFARHTQQTGAPIDERGARIVWRWLLDGSYRIAALFAFDEAKTLAGIAHYRPFPDVLAGQEACALDALFVDGAYRGQGLEELLVSAVYDVAVNRGWSEVRWAVAGDVGGTLSGAGSVERTALVTYRIPVVRSP